MTIDGEENSLYLLVPQKNSLKSVNIIGYQTVMELDVGEDAYGIAVMGER